MAVRGLVISTALHSLLARHRDDRDEEGRATRVDQTEVDVGIAARDVLEAIDEHRVPGDVEPVEVIAVAAEVEQVPVDRHEQLVDCVVGRVLGRHGGDSQRRVTFAHLEGFPGVERMARLEAESAELVHRVSRRDDGQFLVELLGGDVIEMIAVVVRQDDQIYRWQVSDLASRLDLASGPNAVTQVDVLAFVQEGGIGQDRQSAERINVVALPMK